MTFDAIFRPNYPFFFFVHILVFYIFAGGETLQYWNNLFVKQRELKMAKRF